MRCQGFAKTKGRQCCNSALNGHDFCHWHPPLCSGLTKHGLKCRAKAIPILNYLYCRKIHIPGAESTDPKQFRLENLRSDRGSAVLEHRNNLDRYTKRSVETLGRGLDVDHVLELHVLRDAFDKIRPTGNGFPAKKNALQKDLSTLANQVQNLNVTTSDINQIKFREVQQFQHNYNHDVLGNKEMGLVHNLIEAEIKSINQTKLSRNQTRRIQKEFVNSYEHVRDGLQDEDHLAEQMIELLHCNMVAMRLY